MDDTTEPMGAPPNGTEADRLDAGGVVRNVRDMVRPFDPVSADAEDQYDAVVRRVNRVRARRTRLTRELERLERPFVDDDLVVQSGPRRGQPLSTNGRKRRLARLVEVGAELRRVEEEERFAVASLGRMNRALDRWARDTYGV